MYINEKQLSKQHFYRRIIMSDIKSLEKILPNAPLKIIAMESCKDMGKKVNDYIVSFREGTVSEAKPSPLYENYESQNYLASAKCSRFGSGEAKGTLGRLYHL